MFEKTAISILVLDDDPLMLKLLSRMLTTLGYPKVICCEHGQAALLYVDQPELAPNLILLDLNMPEMDGVEFIRHLVEHRYTGSLILISGEDERMLQATEKLIRVHKIQVLGHLQKPVTPTQLAALLGKWSPATSAAPDSTQKIYHVDELRAALRNGELVNHYQPKVSLETGVVIGVETLVRWQHPVDGMVFPDQFIALAEKNGLIDELTNVVLLSALAQAKKWQDAGLQLKVAINVSMDNLTSLDFVNFVVQQTALAGVPPHQIVLEVTESRVMQDTRTSLEILARLRMKRFRLSIDDFGTGNSSLVQLRDIPFDELKIDYSFVHGAGSNPTLRSLFDASLTLAKKLNMEVVAEGVEDEHDWHFLRSTGCDIAQGYFVAKPMVSENLASWIVAWQARWEKELLLIPCGSQPAEGFDMNHGTAP